MRYQVTTATRRIAKLRKRIRAVQGGTSASKTITILLLLIDFLQVNGDLLCSVVSESIPHLKRGAMRDFESIMRGHGYWEEDSWSKTDFIYTFPNGSRLEFFGADSPDKLRGPRRDILFINEANNVPHSAFDQLESRTRLFVFLDWNPSHEFWFYTEVLPHRDDVDHIILTYKDNEALEPEIVKTIEARQHNKSWWQVYGLGLLGETEARIYTGWAIIDDIPHEARLARRGLDYGYANDPTAIVDVYQYNGGIILDEILYRKGMGNKEIADILKSLENQITTRADSSEPKSNDEITSYGVSILPAAKGQGSVLQGIQFLQGMRVSVTKRSVNLIKEYRNYLWDTDKDGRIVNVPMDRQADHLLDAARYAVEGLYDRGGKAAEYSLFESISRDSLPQNQFTLMSEV